MKRLLKKNQVIITILAVMIAIAGYLNYSGNLLEKEADQMTSTKGSTILLTAEDAAGSSASAQSGNYIDVVSLDGEEGQEVSADDALQENGASSSPGEAVLASTTAGDQMIAQAKLNREQVRAKNKETLQQIIDSENIAEEQRLTAAASMTAMADLSEREAAAELLLEAKGFTDSVVSITDGTADVVINLAQLDEAQRAQVEDIVRRKTDVPAENIIITPRG